MDRKWWKEAIVYQVYPRSFKDSDKDGIGDLRGLIQKLDYIRDLGANVIWLCPVYRSPNDDNGYDISDYREIMPEFGSMKDFDELLSEIHRRGMRLVMDLVANHTSDEHDWFMNARQNKESDFRDYYFFRPGKEGGPPNNWKSFFGGSAWEYEPETDEYYLHLFTRKQPDLNWENPKVRNEIYDIIRFWFDKGVDGFRMDVISLISKKLNFPDATSENFGQVINELYANGPRIHEFLHEMNREVLSHYDIMTVGEGPGIDLENGLDYVAEEREELNMIFHFDHMFLDCGDGGKYDPVPYDFLKFKRIFKLWDEKLDGKGWASIFLGNHDFSRIVSRFGNDEEFRTQSATLLCTMLLSMRGTPYIYQGEEIGMTNVKFPSIENYRDVETLNAWKEAEDHGLNMEEFLKNVHWQSRDNARTPMHWSDEKYAGFSSERPWIDVNPNYPEINVSKQENDPHSVLNYYKGMINYRKKNPALIYGSFDILREDDPDLFIYERKDDSNHYLVILNFSESLREIDFSLNGFNCEMCNYHRDLTESEIRPWEARIYRKPYE